MLRKISDEEARETLKIWKEIFFKLDAQDKKLARDPKNLYERANAIRQKHQGNSCCVHAIIEFSNYCRCDCLYCGIRRGNTSLNRYRMEIPEILAAVGDAVKLGFQAFILQSGEDIYYTDDLLVEIVKEIRKKYSVLLFMSVGERSLDAYRRMYDAGARGVLLRFETSNEKLYEKMKPNDGNLLNRRTNLIRCLREMGYLIVTGSLIGLPGQTAADIMKDIKMTADLGAEMFSFGPFISHSDTPLAGAKTPTLKKILDTIAQARIMNPDAKILVTTALETLWGLDGAKEALMAGANSLMINVTPQKYRKLYDIYPKRFGTDLDVQEHINAAIDLLKSLGRAPTDLSVS
ncbi:MAG: [FeFe] hydrogenase H-cluster radical SAM maturase HydE [Deltaproteobacteria bacterium]|nr:[FeFe] hydrogenase H-cluster radical SAM maturase HydE [Deltaproteobacteria bacterium]